MDVSKLRPHGPWILVKMDPPPEKSLGGLYLPQGNLDERLGNATGVVLSLGQGSLLSEKARKRTGRKYDPIDLDPGMRIAFRGYIQEANQVGGLLDREHSLIHVDDVIGEVLEGDRVG